MNELVLLRPWWLLALIPLLAACIALWRRSDGAGQWRRVIDPQLRQWMLESDGDRRTTALPWLLLALAWLLSVLALAGPAWERLPQPVHRKVDALVLVLDLSASMYTQDLQPSRIARARHKLSDILARRSEAQTALIAFAGAAFVVTPFSDDAATLTSQLQGLDPSLMPVPGSKVGSALELAADMIRRAQVPQARILLVTDGLGTGESAASLAEVARHPVDVLLVGSDVGGPIPLPEGGFLRNRAGEIVIADVDAAPLRELARRSGGRFARLQPDDRDIERLLARTDIGAATEQLEGRTFDQYREEGPWLLLLLLPLAALGYRRGWLGTALLLVLVLPPEPAHALDWEDLWARPDQRGFEAYAAEDYEGASEQFVDPRWRGSARFRAGDYDAAAEDFGSRQDADSLYNRGTALARSGRLDEALQAFDAALELDPEMEDALYNRSIVEKLLQRQQQQQSNQQQEDPSGEQQEQQRGPQQQSGAGQQQQQQSDGQQQQQRSDGQRSSPAQESDEASHAGPADAERSAPAETAPGEKSSARDAGRNQEPQGEAGEAAPELAGELPASGTEEAKRINPQLAEQLLRRIPDDPGGLLRQKFLYQYQQRSQRQEQPEQTW